MKECRKCHVKKSAEDFPKSKTNKDGLHSYCRVCQNTYVRERYVGKQKTEEQKARQRGYARRYRYGITPEAYDTLMEKQGHACAVCKETFSDTLRPNVDHDHRCCPGVKTCGKCVRGLLCSGCLAFAGLIETRFHTHEAMFSYLHLHLENRWGTIKLTEQSKS